MEKRFVLFIVLSIGVMVTFMAANIFLGQWFGPDPNVAQQADGADEADGDADGGDADGGKADDADGKPEQAADGAGQADAGKVDAAADAGEPADGSAKPPMPPDGDKPPPGGEAEKPPVEPAKPRQPLGVAEAQRKTLGSLDPESRYSFLSIFNSQGAALERIELNDPKYRDLVDTSGYLGHLALESLPDEGGCRVHVVGPGTPAATAPMQPGGKTLQPGDVIVAFDGQQVPDIGALNRLLKKKRPGDKVQATVMRDEGGASGSTKYSLTITLRDRPLEVIRPEPRDGDHPNPLDVAPPHDPLSLLATIGAQVKSKTGKAGTAAEFKVLEELRTANWNVRENTGENVVEFFLGPAEGLTEELLAEIGLSGKLEIVRRYRLDATTEADQKAGKLGGFKSHHVTVEIELKNVGDTPINDVHYVLDGPNGLPTEGWWYSYKVGPDMFAAAGARDVLYRSDETELAALRKYAFITCYTIFAQAEKGKDDPKQPNAITVFDRLGPPEQRTLHYAGVDAQYFSAVLIPGTLEKRKGVFERFELTPADPQNLPDNIYHKLTNVSFTLTSRPFDLEPGASHTEKFVLFAGPKQPDLISAYQLDDFIYYGWFGYVSQPLVHVLHFFYWATGYFSYGLAIVMLTVLVRGCMFPISRKAVRNALMMQALAPEMKALTEKYKTDMEKRGKAQRELFAKYNYNPFGGCLLMFLQLPIFLGLYRALCVDLELRGAPLIPGLAWCSNLAAPDMLFSWEGLWDYFTAPTGWLGPYFNLLPLFTVALFAVQQKMFTPPPTDDQQKMTQNMMMWMTLFMGLMFFKVPAGLCLYFITSSLWGVLERKVFPKPKLPGDLQKKMTEAANNPSGPGKPAKPGGNGAAKQAWLKKEKGRR